jgi:hypothetical protein
MNTRFALEYTMFVSIQLLRNWREQRPSNQGDIDYSVPGEVGTVYCKEVDQLLISLGCALNGTLCNPRE